MKKYLIILLVLAFQSFSLKAQKTAKDSIFTSPEVDAEFPGGIQSFFHFLGENMIYPPGEVRTHTTGKVTVSFVVETNGQLTNITLVKSVSPDLDKEAIRVVGLSPRWEPAKQNKQRVRARYTFPVTFYLPALPVIQDGLDTIYAKPDELPKYLDGENEMMKFIGKNVRTTVGNVKGNCVVVFVVEKDGKITHINILTSPNASMKAEATRLIQSLSGKFIPAKQNDLPVRGQYMVLIPF